MVYSVMKYIHHLIWLHFKHVCMCVCVCYKDTKIYSLNKFQVYNTVLLTIVSVDI